MKFFDKKMKMAEAQTEKLIGDYAQALNSHQDTSSVKTMVATGAPAASIADKAASIHQVLFQALLESSDAPQVLKSQQRVKIIEQFCLSLWGNLIGNGPYSALLAKLKQPTKSFKAKSG